MQTTPSSWGAPAPKRPWWKRRTSLPVWGAVGLGVAILATGSAIGATGQQTPKTKTVTKVETRTVTKTVPGPTRTVSDVPANCANALDAAEQIIGSSRDALGAGAEVIRLQNEALQIAASALTDPLSVDDAAGSHLSDLSTQVDDQNAKIQDLTAKVTAEVDSYQTESAACRAASAK